MGQKASHKLLRVPSAVATAQAVREREREREVLSVFCLCSLAHSISLSLSPSLCSLEFVIKTGDNNGDYCE